jgi:hypothetical protein
MGEIMPFDKQSQIGSEPSERMQEGAGAILWSAAMAIIALIGWVIYGIWSAV